MYRNETCLYIILLADPILGERELCMSIAQFTPKSVATELCEYMWILCFLIVTKTIVFYILCNRENEFQSLINYEMHEHWHNA